MNESSTQSAIDWENNHPEDDNHNWEHIPMKKDEAFNIINELLSMIPNKSPVEHRAIEIFNKIHF